MTTDDRAQPGLSRVRLFRRKAVECFRLATIAQHPQSKSIYSSLALRYEKLASHAEDIARQAISGGRKKSD